MKKNKMKESYALVGIIIARMMCCNDISFVFTENVFWTFLGIIMCMANIAVAVFILAGIISL